MKTAWERVEIARNPNRKTSLDYIEKIFDEFVELHGDRISKDDSAMVCGLAKIGNQNFTVIAGQKGRNTKGAYPGIEAEEKGQGEAIAKSMFEMAKLKVPIITIVIGEGSSGGALAISIANKIIMLENVIYSILSPEGYASILWKDSSRAQEAAGKMKLTAQDLYNFKIIDKIIEEKEEFEIVAKNMSQEILKLVNELNTMSKTEIIQQRYLKFRQIGDYKERK